MLLVEVLTRVLELDRMEAKANGIRSLALPTFVRRAYPKTTGSSRVVTAVLLMKALSTKKQVADTATDALRCGFCDKVNECKLGDVLPFEDACVYDRTIARRSVKPRKL